MIKIYAGGMKSLHENHTDDFVKLPNDKKALQNKWVFLLKHKENSSHSRYKVGLAVKGFD